MICRNCNYILTGNEQFCPHCATPVTKKDTDDSAALPPPIFSSDKHRDNDEINHPSNKIFHSPEHADEEDTPKSKKGAVLISLTLLLVFLCGCAVFLAEKLDISPVISSLISDSTKDDVTQSEEALITTRLSELDDNYGVVPADISYKPRGCFIGSSSSVPMRKGPDDAYAQITTLKVGQALQIIGGSMLTDKWLYIYHPEADCYGWVKAAFLSSADSLEESSEQGDEETTSEVPQQEVSE